MRKSCFNNLLPPNYRIAKCRGQVAVLFALFIPLLFLILGLVLDLGWYYLNVSRLQNAADAAAVAGAHALIKDDEEDSVSTIFSDYKNVKLVGKYPDKDGNKYRVDNIYELTAIENSNVIANEYVAKNLSSNENTIINSWTKTEVQSDEELYEKDDNLYYVVKLKEEIRHFFLPGWFDDMAAPVTAVALISKRAIVDDVVISDLTDTNDVDTSDVTDTPNMPDMPDMPNISDASDMPDGMPNMPDPPSYLTLNFNANGGYFNNDETDNQSSKKLKALEDIEDDDKLSINSGKGTPTYSNNTKEFKGWSTEKNQSADSPIAYYYDGKQLTKSEIEALFGSNTTVTLYAVWVDKTTTSDTDTTPEITNETITPHNNRTLWEQMQYLIAKNVYDPDWDVSVQKYGKVGETAKIVHNSFDKIDNTYVNSYHYYTEYINLGKTAVNTTNLAGETRYFIDFRRNDWLSVYCSWYYSTANTRVHSLFNVNKAYSVRSGYNDDPLYIRIEAEPGKDGQSSETAYYATPIRQIVININADNKADSKRPLFFFYDGPDKVKSNNAEPQPVILNLNADFKGALFMPEVPVVINGNGHTFEGFIVAKEFRYLDRSNGSKVKYSSNGQTITNASDNKIRINTSNGNVYSVKATGEDAIAIYNNNATDANKFYLSSASKFRTFKAETGVKFMYVFYDNDLTMDETPFHEYCDTGKDLIPLYDGNGKRVTNWANVKLYDSDNSSSRNEIPKQLTDNTKIRTVRLDSDGNPLPIYDEYGNPVYFCEDYVKLAGTYEVFTLDRVADGTRDPRDPHEFLLTADTANVSNSSNVSNTDDWK